MSDELFLKLKTSLTYISILCIVLCNAQDFHFIDRDSKSERLDFQLISNMIVIPVEINGVELSFIFDTGANATLLFNTTHIDSLLLNDAKEIRIKGLGSSKSIVAINSTNNEIKLGGIINNDQSIKLIIDDNINFSKRLGIPIHGVIGTELLKDFIVEVNYSSQYIKFYSPTTYRKKKLQRYQKVDLEIHKDRCFLISNIQLNQKEKRVKLLLDSGSSDAIWLFVNKDIAVPETYFTDYMGTGIAGNIYGRRSLMDRFSLGRFTLEDVNVAFPDSEYIKFIKGKIDRNGSIGASMIKRFNLVLDIESQALYIKKNKYFKEPFEYNRSGLEIEHAGSKEVVILNPNLTQIDGNHSLSIKEFYTMKLVPIYKITQVRLESPAYGVGIRSGDVLVSINKDVLDHKKIDEVRSYLSVEEGEEINVVIDREGEILEFSFVQEEIMKKAIKQ